MPNYAKLCQIMPNYAKLCKIVPNYAKFIPNFDHERKQWQKTSQLKTCQYLNYTLGPRAARK